MIDSEALESFTWDTVERKTSSIRSSTPSLRRNNNRPPLDIHITERTLNNDWHVKSR